MITLLSPSKTQDFASEPPIATHTQPALLNQSALLAKELRRLSVADISRLMTVSEKIATLNHERYRRFTFPFTSDNAKQAIFAFKGDVYDGFDAETMDASSLIFAQNHLRILSGLYGVLRPFDLIQPYRLEMKIRLKTTRGADLYRFWENRITDALNAAIEATGSRFVVNLASHEYFKAVNLKRLIHPVITPHFKEKKGGSYRIIALFAKRARGAMARYIADNAIINPQTLKLFAADGYRFNAKLSQDLNPVFTRE